MRKRKLLLALAGLAVVVGAVVFVLWPQSVRCTDENFDRLGVGMTRAEVQAILGPSGDHATGPLDWRVKEGEPPFRQFGEMTLEDVPPTTVLWLDDGGAITVDFDQSGRACLGSYNKAESMPQSLFDNLLWRAKRRWHRWFPE
jgi:hypothetical protein